MSKPIITISQRGRVTLKIDAADLASMIADAAVGEAPHTCTPSRELYESLAAVLADYFDLYHPDASQGLLLDDVKHAYAAAEAARIVPPT